MLRTTLRFACALALALTLTFSTFSGEKVSPNADKLAEALGVIITPLTARSWNSATAEHYANTMLTSLSTQRLFVGTMPSIADYSQTAHMTGSLNGNSFCDASGSSRWVMWDTPFATRERQRRDDGYLGYNYTTSGFATGLSRLIGDSSAIGLAVGYDYRKQDGRNDYYMKDRADAFHAALYGGTSIGCFFFDAYAGYSRAWHRSKRQMEQTLSPIVNSGNFNDTILSAGVKATYVWILPNEMRVTASAGLDYSHVSLDGFHEKSLTGPTNATLLRVRDSSYDALRLPIMVSANKTFTSNFLKFGGVCSLWTPEVRAGWVPQFGARRAEVGANFNYPGTNVNFKSNSADRGTSYGTIGAGVKLKLKDKYIFALDYDLNYRSKNTQHVLTAAYGVSF